MSAGVEFSSLLSFLGIDEHGETETAAMLPPVAHSTLNTGQIHIEKMEKTIESANDLFNTTASNFDDNSVRLNRLAFDDRSGADPRELALRDAIAGYSEAHNMVSEELSTGVESAVKEMDATTRRWLTFQPLADPEWWKHARPDRETMPLTTAEGVSAFCITNTRNREKFALHCAQVGGWYCLAGIRVAVNASDPYSEADKQGRLVERTEDVMFPTERRDAFFIESTYPLVGVDKPSGEYICHFLTGIGLMSSDTTLFLSGYRMAYAPLAALFGDWRGGEDATLVSCVNVDCNLQEACGSIHSLTRTAANDSQAASWCNPGSDRVTGAVRSSLIDKRHETAEIAVDMNDTSVQGEWIQIKVTVDHGVCLVIRNGWGLLMAVQGHPLRCTRISVSEKSERRDDPCTISLGVARSITLAEELKKKSSSYIHGHVAETKMNDILLHARPDSKCKMKKVIRKVETFEKEREEKDIYWCGRTTPGRSALKWPLIVTPVSPSALSPTHTLQCLSRGDVMLSEGTDGFEEKKITNVIPTEDLRYIPERDPLLHALMDTETLKVSCGSDTELRFDAVAGAISGVLSSMACDTSSARCTRVEERYRRCEDAILRKQGAVNDKDEWSKSEQYLASSLALEEAAASTIASGVTKRLVEKTLVGMRLRSVIHDDTVYLTGARNDTGILSICNHRGKLSIGLSTSALVGDDIKGMALDLRQWITELVYASQEKGNVVSQPSSSNGTSLLPPSMASVPLSCVAEYVDRLMGIIHKVPNPKAFMCMLILFIMHVNEKRPRIKLPPTDCVLSDSSRVLNEDDKEYEEKMKRAKTQTKRGRIVLTGRDVAKVLTALSRRGVMTGSHNTIDPCNCGKTFSEGCPWMIPDNHWLLSQSNCGYGCKKEYVKLAVSGAHLRRAWEEELARLTLYWMRALTLLIESFDSQILVNNLPLARATEWYCNTVVRNRILDSMVTQQHPSSHSGITDRVREMSRALTDDAVASATLFHSVHNSLDWTPTEKMLQDTLVGELGFHQHSWQANALKMGTFVMRGLTSRSPVEHSERLPKLYALHALPKHVSGPYFVILDKTHDPKKPQPMGVKHKLPLHTTAEEAMALTNQVTGSAVMTIVPQRVIDYRSPSHTHKNTGAPCTVVNDWEIKSYMRSDYLNQQDFLNGTKTQKIPPVTMGALLRPKTKIRVIEGEDYVMKDVWCGLVALNRSAWMERVFGYHTGSRMALWTPVKNNENAGSFEIKCMTSLESQWKSTLTAAASLAVVSNVSRLAGPMAIKDFLQQETPVDLIIEWGDNTTTLVSTGSEMAPTFLLPGSTQKRSSALTSFIGPDMVTVPHRLFMFAFNLYCQQIQKSSSLRPQSSTIGTNAQLSKKLIQVVNKLNKKCMSTKHYLKKIERKRSDLAKNKIIINRIDANICGAEKEEGNGDRKRADIDETYILGIIEEDNKKDYESDTRHNRKNEREEDEEVLREVDDEQKEKIDNDREEGEIDDEDEDDDDDQEEEEKETTEMMQRNHIGTSTSTPSPSPLLQPMVKKVKYDNDNRDSSLKHNMYDDMGGVDDYNYLNNESSGLMPPPPEPVRKKQKTGGHNGARFDNFNTSSSFNTSSRPKELIHDHSDMVFYDYENLEDIISDMRF
uniref:Wsv151-like protein n=1 Tax=Penaeus monodon endogenous nimavirus TaxID=2133795 RepID=A0A401IPM1_9VIRU|nr:MAG: wsv151-like protein [Penaeus monodon endogenous nimavirus]GBG35559.1 wsv151-like protein [Penaeus monodon endogenous nimavirus]